MCICKRPGPVSDREYTLNIWFGLVWFVSFSSEIYLHRNQGERFSTSIIITLTPSSAKNNNNSNK